MKVVLTADVSDLGRKGDVKDVADGYARNFLIPRKLATAATPSQLKQLRDQDAAQARREAKMEGANRAFAQRINDAEVRLSARSGDQGRLYGSITNADVAEGPSKALGQTIDKRLVDLPDPIKQAGEHKVKVRVARGIEATATVVIDAEHAYDRRAVMRRGRHRAPPDGGARRYLERVRERRITSEAGR